MKQAVRLQQRTRSVVASPSLRSSSATLRRCTFSISRFSSSCCRRLCNKNGARDAGQTQCNSKQLRAKAASFCRAGDEGTKRERARQLASTHVSAMSRCIACSRRTSSCSRPTHHTVSRGSQRQHAQRNEAHLLAILVLFAFGALLDLLKRDGELTMCSVREIPRLGPERTRPAPRRSTTEPAHATATRERQSTTRARSNQIQTFGAVSARSCPRRRSLIPDSTRRRPAAPRTRPHTRCQGPRRVFASEAAESCSKPAASSLFQPSVNQRTTVMKQIDSRTTGNLKFQCGPCACSSLGASRDSQDVRAAHAAGTRSS